MANNLAADAFSGAFGNDGAASRATAPGTSIKHLIDSITQRFAVAHQRRLDAEVGAFISSHGGQLTDDLERQISQRFGTHAGL